MCWGDLCCGDEGGEGSLRWTGVAVSSAKKIVQIHHHSQSIHVAMVRTPVQCEETGDFHHVVYYNPVI